MIALVVHGGAWDIPDDLVAGHRAGVLAAVNAGWELLSNGASALDTAVRAVTIMEDDETFDAGRGSFVNADGNVELDASVMDGRTLRAGAVAAVQNIRNPILLARKVMDESEHILLVGEGASRFAREHGIDHCSREDLVTPRELERWRKLSAGGPLDPRDAFRKFADTVGAVALDSAGNIATATSTGGTPNKYPGRVGDSPLIGIGTYADNGVGGVSTTGWGESMIKVVMAKTVLDLIERNGGDAVAAATQAISHLERRVGGYGGVIALGAGGAIGVAYNTPRMARAFLSSDMVEPAVAV
jgi:beta-aspartyl-peptidase (threonine type)